jgi:hypothetical protein
MGQKPGPELIFRSRECVPFPNSEPGRFRHYLWSVHTHHEIDLGCQKNKFYFFLFFCRTHALMSRQTNHPLKTQSPHLLPLYAMRRSKRVTCRYRAAALQRSRLATPNGGRTGYFRSQPWNHKSRLVHSRCFSGSISHLLRRFRARPCLHANANVRSLVNAGPRST